MVKNKKKQFLYIIEVLYALSTNKEYYIYFSEFDYFN